jgi:SAM-dependent methyltransferase
MKTDQIRYYSQRAKEYEKIYTLPERQKNISEIKHFLKKSFSKKEVFEIACGTGYWTRFIGETAKSIFATDINASVLEIAQAKKYACPVQFKEADIFDLSFINKTFYSGFAGFIWSHILKQDLQNFIEQFLSKINKNGLVLFVDNTYVEGSSTPLDSTDDFGNTYQNRTLQSGSKFTVVKNYPTNSEILRLINPVGINLNIKKLDYFWILTFNKK